MKKYRLLKDTIWHKAGEVFEIDEDEVCLKIGGIKFHYTINAIYFSEFFEEITEPETYTKQDMINFADQCIATYREKQSVKIMYELSVYKPHQPVKEERKWTDQEIKDFGEWFNETPALGLDMDGYLNKWIESIKEN